MELPAALAYDPMSSTFAPFQVLFFPLFPEVNLFLTPLSLQHVVVDFNP